jgi:hypothetical protein
LGVKGIQKDSSEGVFFIAIELESYSSVMFASFTSLAQRVPSSFKNLVNSSGVPLSAKAYDLRKRLIASGGIQLLVKAWHDGRWRAERATIPVVVATKNV